MTEIGETVAVSIPKKQKEKKGDLKVKVVNRCNGSDNQPVEIEGAEVTVKRDKKTTNAAGEAEFTGLKATSYTAYAEKHFAEADYITFLAHYIFPFGKITRSHKAISKGSVNVDVPDGGKGEGEIPLAVYRLVDLVEFKRKYPLEPGDEYGHWWTEIDGAESYGWWPAWLTQPPAASPPTPPPANAGWAAQISHKAAVAAHSAKEMYNDIRYSGYMQTMLGTTGDLNGQQQFGGTPTMDPHHGDSGSDEFQPVVNDCRSDADIKDELRDFANAYTGDWSWRLEFGKNCHTFQKDMIDDAQLKFFKEL